MGSNEAGEILNKTNGQYEEQNKRSTGKKDSTSGTNLYEELTVLIV